jgi:hypothetical protein
MSGIVEVLHGITSEQEGAERLGTYLGLGAPVPLPVLRRAIVDERFAGHLLVNRDRPAALGLFLTDPRNEAFDTGAPPARVADRSSLSLLWSAGKGAARWGASGFRMLSDAEFGERVAACRRCPNLVEPPGNLVYRLHLSPQSDRRVCAACGCVAVRKARLPTERCPVQDPARPGYNRWGQPLNADPSSPPR